MDQLTPIPASDLRLLLVIRRFEEALLDLFAKGKLNGTTHTCLGQEYIPVALRSLLKPDDFVFSNHRGHGHYLARFDDPAGLLAEIMGREGAVCCGVGGSQHIYRDGSYLSTGIQGESMPVAVGVALHFKRTRPGSLAVVHIGDGTWGEGTIYEALNMAQLWKVPLVVVVENNGIAQSTPTELQMAGTIAARAQAFDIRHVLVDSIDIARIRETLAGPIQGARKSPAPLMIEFATQRLGPHSKGDDTRDAKQIEALRARDWYGIYKRQLGSDFEALDEAVTAAIEHIRGEVDARPLARWEPA
jgi:acetoin:2,6-dichlorophenolindophenol oxidoreductase subunit alpha